jgi:hypothetical protein
MKKLFVLLAAFMTLAFAMPAPAQAANAVPQFGYIAPGWLPVQSFPLDAVWHAFGFQEGGISYYSIGGPPNGSTPYWERFDPTGTTYESFFGAYVITNFPFAQDWNKPNLQPSDILRTANELVALGNADQFAWLSFYGGPTGSTLVPNSLHVFPADSGFFLVTFLVSTFSDMGAASPPAPFDPPYSVYQNVVPAYEPITAEAFVLIKYDFAHANLLAIYGSGAQYNLSNGTPKNTPAATIFQIGKMMAATTFQ